MRERCLSLFRQGLTPVLAWAAAASSDGAEVFIAADGSDSNPVTREAPFASVPAAHETIRAMREDDSFPTDGVTVYLREGMYFLGEPFALEPEDGGSATAPVVYRADAGEHVVLSGRRTVTGFEPVKDSEVLSRLDPKAQGKVFCDDLRVQGAFHRVPAASVCCPFLG